MSGKTPPHLRPFVEKSSSEENHAEEWGLPPFDGAAYAAHGRVANKPLYAIHFLSSNGNGRTFEYVDMRSRCAEDDDFRNDRFTLAFLGMRAVTVTVVGRNLHRLYDYIHQHRMPWVMEVAAGRDFVPDGTPVVTTITVDPLREPQESGRS